MEHAGSSASGQKGRLFSSGYLFSIFFVGLGGLRRPNGFLIPEGGNNSESSGERGTAGKVSVRVRCRILSFLLEW